MGTDGYINREHGSTEDYYFKNLHGDVTFAFNSGKWRSSEYNYYAWGAFKTNYDYFSDANYIRYSGQFYDKESNLIYLRARYYDNEIMRFITEDPAKDGLNWYAYCGNNPVMRVDFTGLYADGDEELPYAIQLILNGNDGKTGGLTAAWNAANARGDEDAKNRISKTESNIRKFSITNINRVMVLVQTTGAEGLGHTAVLILNESEQGVLLSYHPYPDGSATSEPGEMRIAYMNSKEWNNALYGQGNRYVNLVGSNGYNQSESFNGSLYLSVDSDNGQRGFAELARKFANPGNYNVISNNCDHQTSEIVMAAGKYYDKQVVPNNSFNRTSLYHTNYWAWVFSQ